MSRVVGAGRMAPRTSRGGASRRVVLVGAALGIGAVAWLAWWRGGLLGLPAAPRDVTAAAAGLANWSGLADRARRLETGDVADDAALRRGAEGLRALRLGDIEAGLAALRDALGSAPEDLVLGNTYRMAVFRLRRATLDDAAARTTLAARMPPVLEGEPLRTLTAHATRHPTREARLQVALAWVDEMLLFPALEIKAPASVQSVEILSGLLAEDPEYVPALYGRGLNYLHRPARLVWPEAEKSAPDAASQDLGRAVAIGRKVGGASPQLVATLALALGDAYAKEGRAARARSWWQIAVNACHETEVRNAVQQRLGWRDGELQEQLEQALEARMLDRDHPMTDLALLWRSK